MNEEIISYEAFLRLVLAALDASGVAGLNWDRVVQRHLLPALKQEANRRW